MLLSTLLFLGATLFSISLEAPALPAPKTQQITILYDATGNRPGLDDLGVPNAASRITISNIPLRHL